MWYIGVVYYMKIFNINNVQTVAQIHAKQNQTAENPAK